MSGDLSLEIERAARLADLGRHQEIVTLVTPLLAAHPDQPDLLKAASQAHEQLGHSTTALALARHLVAVDPGAAASHIRLAYAARGVEDHRLAVAAAWQAVRLDPSSPVAHYAHGDHLLFAGEDGWAAPALAAFDEAARLNPAAPQTHNMRGLALSRLGRRHEAAAAYKHALALDPTCVEASINLGVLNLRRGRVGRAAQMGLAVVRMDPGRTEVAALYEAVICVLLWRLHWLQLLLCVVLLAVTGEEPDDPRRLLLGAAACGVWVLVVAITVRLGPPDLLHHVGGVVRRSRDWQLVRIVLLAWSGGALLAGAFAPQPAASIALATTAVVLQWAVIGAVLNRCVRFVGWIRDHNPR